MCIFMSHVTPNITDGGQQNGFRENLSETDGLILDKFQRMSAFRKNENTQKNL